MNKRLLCIYHSHCDDGFGAAWSVRHATAHGSEFLQDYTGVDYYAAVHSGKVPDVKDRDVVMVDFVYPAAIMDRLIEDCNSIKVLDHHKSSMNDMLAWAADKPKVFVAKWGPDGGLVQVQTPKGALLFDMSRSGAMMAWDHYHPGIEAPDFIKYIQDHDLWTKKLPKIDQFTAGLRSWPMDFDLWDRFVDDKVSMEELFEQGSPILRYKHQLVDIAVKNSFWVQLQVPVKNAFYANSPHDITPATETIRIRGANVMPAISSEVGEALALRYGGQSLTWIEGFKWTYGLRSRAIGDQPAPDVSLIATAMGGGGHAQAAGFKSMFPVHTKWTAPDTEEEGS